MTTRSSANGALGKLFITAIVGSPRPARRAPGPQCHGVISSRVPHFPGTPGRGVFSARKKKHRPLLRNEPVRSEVTGRRGGPPRSPKVSPHKCVNLATQLSPKIDLFTWAHVNCLVQVRPRRPLHGHHSHEPRLFQSNFILTYLFFVVFEREEKLCECAAAPERTRVPPPASTERLRWRRPCSRY